jgi:hypothetical protein
MSKNYLKKSKQKTDIFNTALIEQLKRWEGKNGTMPAQDKPQKQG